MSKCQFENCQNFVVRKGFCLLHLKERIPEIYEQYIQNQRERKARSICSVENCGHRINQKSLCNKHFREQFPEEYENTLNLRSQKKCSIEICDNKVRMFGLCLPHLREKYPDRYEEILKYNRGRLDYRREHERCKVSDCDKAISRKGLCKAHLREFEPEYLEQYYDGIRKRRYDRYHSDEEYRQRQLALKKIQNKKMYPIYKKQAIAHYSNGTMKCMCPDCDENRLQFLTIDHINGGGNKHKTEIKNRNIYRWLAINNFPSKPALQVLCYNCNCARGNRGKCPVHEQLL